MVMSGDAFKGGTVVFTFVIDDKGMKEGLKKVGADINAVHKQNTQANRQALLDQKKDFNAKQKLANQALNEQLRGDKHRRADFTHKIDQENKRLVSLQRKAVQTEKINQSQTANRIKHEQELARNATFDQKKRFNDQQRLASQALNEQLRADKVRQATLTDKVTQENKRQVSAQKKRLEIEKAQQTKELNRRNYASQISGLQAKEAQRANTQRIEREKLVQARMRSAAQREQLASTRARNAQKRAAAAQQANAKTTQTLENVGKAAGVAGAALMAFSGLGVLAAQRQEIAERRLAAALEANYINRDMWFDKFKDQANELSRISNFANQDILNLQDTLIRQTKSADIAFQLTPGILDVSAMRDQDWRELAAQMSRAAKGQTLTIESASLELPDHLLDMSVQERAKEIAKILEKDYGGSMESARKAQVSFGHTLQDTFELMGSGVFVAMEKTLGIVQKILIPFNEWSAENKWLAQTIGWVVAGLGLFLVVGGGGIWVTLKIINGVKELIEAYKIAGKAIRTAVIWIRRDSVAKTKNFIITSALTIKQKSLAAWTTITNKAIVANTLLTIKNTGARLASIAMTVILTIKTWLLTISIGAATVAAAIFWTVATLGIALVVLAIIALIAWVVRLVKKWGGFGAAMKKIWGFVVDTVKKHWKLILGVLFPVIGLPILIWRNWSKIIDYVKEIFGTVLRIIGSVVEALTFGTVGQGITDLGDRLRGDLPKQVNVGVTPVLAEDDDSQSWLDKIIAAAATPIVWTWNLGGNFLTNAINWWNAIGIDVFSPLRIAGAAGRTIVWLWNLGGNFLRTATAWLAGAAKTIQDGVGTVLAWTWNLAGNFTSAVTSAVITFAQWLWDKTAKTFGWIWNLTGDFVSKVTSAVIDFAKWIWDKTTKTFGWIWNIAGDFVTKVTDAVISFAQWIWDKATKTFSWVWDIAGTVFTKVTDAIIGFASAVIEGAKDTIGWVWDLAGNFATKAKEWFDNHGNKLIKYAGEGISWIVALVAGNVALAVSTWIGWISTGISWAVTLAKGASKAVATWLGYAVDGISWTVNLVKGTVGSTVQGWITNITNGIKWIVQLVKGTAASTLAVLADWVSNTINWVVNLSGTISKAVSDFLAAGAAAFSALVSGTKSLILNLTGNITTAVSNFIASGIANWNAVVAGTKNLILNLSGTISDAVEDAIEAWGKVVSDTKNLVLNLSGTIASAISTFITTGIANWNAIATATKSLILNVSGSIVAAVNTFITSGIANWNAVVAGTKNLVLNLSGTISNAVEDAIDAWKSVVADTKNLILNLTGNITKTVSDFITSGISAWNAVVAGTKSLVLNLTGTITASINTFLSNVGDTWNAIKSGTKSIVLNLSGTLSQKVVDFVNANKDWITAIKDEVASWDLDISATLGTLGMNPQLYAKDGFAAKAWDAIEDGGALVLRITGRVSEITPLAELLKSKVAPIWDAMTGGDSAKFNIEGEVTGVDTDSWIEKAKKSGNPKAIAGALLWENVIVPGTELVINITGKIVDFLGPDTDVTFNIDDASLKAAASNTAETNQWLQNIFAALTQSAFRTSNDGSPNLVGAGGFTMSGLEDNGGSKTLRQYMSGGDGAWTEALITKQYDQLFALESELGRNRTLLTDIRQWLSLIWVSGRTDAIVDYGNLNRANTPTTMARGGANADWKFDIDEPKISDYGKPRSGGGGGGLDKTQEDQLSAAATGAKAAADAVGHSTSGLPQIKTAIDGVKAVVDKIPTTGGGGLDASQEAWLKTAFEEVSKNTREVGDHPITGGGRQITTLAGFVKKELKIVKDKINGADGFKGGLWAIRDAIDDSVKDSGGSLKTLIKGISVTGGGLTEDQDKLLANASLQAGEAARLAKELKTQITRDDVGLWAIRDAIDTGTKDSKGGIRRLVKGISGSGGGGLTDDQNDQLDKIDKLALATELELVKTSINDSTKGIWAIRNAIDGIASDGSTGKGGLKAILEHATYGLEAIKNALPTSSNNGNSDGNNGNSDGADGSYAKSDHKHDDRYARKTSLSTLSASVVSHITDYDSLNNDFNIHLNKHPSGGSQPATGHNHDTLYPTKKELKDVKDLAQLARNGDISNAGAINRHINNHPGPAVTGAHDHSEYADDSHSHGADEHTHPLYSVDGHTHGSDPANPSNPQTSGSLTTDQNKWLYRIYQEVGADYSTSAAGKTIDSIRGILNHYNYGLKSVYEDYFSDGDHGFAALLAAMPTTTSGGLTTSQLNVLKSIYNMLAKETITTQLSVNDPGVQTITTSTKTVMGYVQEIIDDWLDDNTHGLDKILDAIGKISNPSNPADGDYAEADHDHDSRYPRSTSYSLLSSSVTAHISDHPFSKDVDGRYGLNGTVVLLNSSITRTRQRVEALAGDAADGLSALGSAVRTIIYAVLTSSQRTGPNRQLGIVNTAVASLNRNYDAAHGVSGTSLDIHAEVPDLTAAVWFHSISNAIEKVRLITKEIQKYLVKKLGTASAAGDFALNYFNTSMTANISLPSTIRHIVSGDAGNTHLDTTSAMAVAGAAAGAYGAAGAASPYADDRIPNISLTINGNVYGVDDLEDAVMQAIRKAKQRGTTMV